MILTKEEGKGIFNEFYYTAKDDKYHREQRFSLKKHHSLVEVHWENLADYSQGATESIVKSLKQYFGKEYANIDELKQIEEMIMMYKENAHIQYKEFYRKLISEIEIIAKEKDGDLVFFTNGGTPFDLEEIGYGKWKASEEFIRSVDVCIPGNYYVKAISKNGDSRIIRYTQTFERSFKQLEEKYPTLQFSNIRRSFYSVDFAGEKGQVFILEHDSNGYYIMFRGENTYIQHEGDIEKIIEAGLKTLYNAQRLHALFEPTFDFFNRYTRREYHKELLDGLLKEFDYEEIENMSAREWKKNGAVEPISFQQYRLYELFEQKIIALYSAKGFHGMFKTIDEAVVKMEELDEETFIKQKEQRQHAIRNLKGRFGV